uniref:Palustrin-2CE n=1 Tax=Rana chensinensis TaxID=79015 RepID=A0A0R8YIH8_9NEOB|nr:Palustrin-2CE precursor [Rana chensinensis]
MFTMKKSMLLLFFLGTISLSLCVQERNADEDEVVEEVRRGLWDSIKNFGKTIALNVMDKIKCKIGGGCPP